MKGRYAGCNMSIYGSILPGAAFIARSAQTSNLSQKAKTRLKWIDWYHNHGQNAESTCRHFSLSKRTFYKWKNRFNPLDLSSLEDQSKRPIHTREPENPWPVTELIKILRKHFPTWSKDKLGPLFSDYPQFFKLNLLLKTIEREEDKERGQNLLTQIAETPRERLYLSSSTIGRIISKKKFFFARPKRSMSSLKKSYIKRKRVDKALKDQAPGSLIQIDTKHLNTPYGRKYYQFTALDCYTRIKFAKCYSSCSSFSAKLFLKELVDYLPFSIQNIQTDNGSEFLRYFHQALKEIKEEEIPHYFSYPHCPKENGRVERVIQTDKYEFYLNGNLSHELKTQNEKLAQWNYIYNHLRPHEALKNISPMEYYEKVKDQFPVHQSKVKFKKIPIFIINQSQPVKAFTM
jgi:putative transposase